MENTQIPPMKYILLLSFLLGVHLLQAQLDTLGLSTTASVSVVIGGEIEVVDIGHPAYISQIHQNTLLLKAAVIDAPRSTCAAPLSPSN